MTDGQPCVVQLTGIRNGGGARLTEGKREMFAVVNESGDPVGIWCSAKREPIKLEGGRFYRLDYLELSLTYAGNMGIPLLAHRGTGSRSRRRRNSP